MLTELRVEHKHRLRLCSKAGGDRDEAFLDGMCQRSREGSGGAFIRSSRNVKIGAKSLTIDDLRIIVIGHETNW